MNDKYSNESSTGAARPPTARGSASANEDSNDWVTTVDAPMTAAQASLLLTLSQAAGEPFEADLSKADASARIEALQEKAGRGHPERILEEEQTDGASAANE